MLLVAVWPPLIHDVLLPKNCKKRNDNTTILATTKNIRPKKPPGILSLNLSAVKKRYNATNKHNKREKLVSLVMLMFFILGQFYLQRSRAYCPRNALGAAAAQKQIYPWGRREQGGYGNRSIHITIDFTRAGTWRALIWVPNAAKRETKRINFILCIVAHKLIQIRSLQKLSRRY